MFKRVVIIGDGAMGTVCGMLLCEKNISTVMWGYDAAQLGAMKAARENRKFLPGYKLPETLEFEADDAKALAGADMIVSAVPCQYMRGVWNRLSGHVPGGVPIVSVAKGIENGTLLRPSQILAEVLGEGQKAKGIRQKADLHHEGHEEHEGEIGKRRRMEDGVRCVALSGPTIADELARKLPATACAASEDEELARAVQETFNIYWLRVYTNNDLVGVELAGAMKNVIAIAAGMLDGIGAGDNAKAALLSRGLAEITRLGIALGAQAKTFSGLTGLGDLVTTCISPLGRNRSLGERIGKGQSAKDAQGATQSVVEGVATCASVVELARREGIEMPITEAVHRVLFEGKAVKEAINDLMTRRLKAE